MPRLREAASRLLGKTARAARFALRTWQAAKGIVFVVSLLFFCFVFVVAVFDIVIIVVVENICFRCCPRRELS